MGVNNNNDNKFVTITLPASSQAQTNDFAKLLKKYFFHWPIFFLSLVVFIVSAYFYLQYTVPVYPVSATIEFKNVKTSDYNTTEKNSLQALDQISSPVIFENEI